MTDLSPAAQAVLDAINKELDEAPWDLSFLAGASAAAALRAAADHARKQQIYRSDWVKQTWILEADLLAIANELDPPNS